MENMYEQLACSKSDLQIIIVYHNPIQKLSNIINEEYW